MGSLCPSSLTTIPQNLFFFSFKNTIASTPMHAFSKRIPPAPFVFYSKNTTPPAPTITPESLSGHSPPQGHHTTEQHTSGYALNWVTPFLYPTPLQSCRCVGWSVHTPCIQLMGSRPVEVMWQTKWRYNMPSRFRHLTAKHSSSRYAVCAQYLNNVDAKYKSLS